MGRLFSPDMLRAIADAPRDRRETELRSLARELGIWVTIVNWRSNEPRLVDGQMRYQYDVIVEHWPCTTPTATCIATNPSRQEAVKQALARLQEDPRFTEQH